jgi:hypothetical protein
MNRHRWLVLTTMALLTALPTLALANPNFCADDPPAPPKRSTKPTLADYANPPTMLLPVKLNKDGSPPHEGLYYDDRGRTFKFNDIKHLVSPEQFDPSNWAFGHVTPGDYYSGTYTYNPGLTIWISDIPIPIPAHTTPDDPVAWRQAKISANNEVERRKAAWGDKKWDWQHGAFEEALCRYNEKGAANRARAEERTSQRLALEGIKASSGSDVPLSAWRFTEHLYTQLDMNQPPDEQQRADDAAAVWASVNRLGTPDAVADNAAMAKRLAVGSPSLAELLAE